MKGVSLSVSGPHLRVTSRAQQRGPGVISTILLGGKSKNCFDISNSFDQSVQLRELTSCSESHYEVMPNKGMAHCAQMVHC